MKFHLAAGGTIYPRAHLYIPLRRICAALSSIYGVTFSRVEKWGPEMAIFSLSVQIITSSKGQSALASSAYRSGTILNNDSTGEQHDYSRRRDVAFTHIFLPPDAPMRFADRAVLWNSVHHATKRRDGQLARSLCCAIPRELPFQSMVALLTDFAGVLVSRGMIVDAALHWTPWNPHLHFLSPLRAIKGDGFGKIQQEWNHRGLVSQLREIWTTLANQALSKAGVHQVISHRTLADQGLKRPPTRHVGARVSAMARKGNPWAIALEQSKRETHHDLKQVRKSFLKRTITDLRNSGLEPGLGGTSGFQPVPFAPADCATVGDEMPHSEVVGIRRR